MKGKTRETESDREALERWEGEGGACLPPPVPHEVPEAVTPVTAKVEECRWEDDGGACPDVWQARWEALRESRAPRKRISVPWRTVAAVLVTLKLCWDFAWDIVAKLWGSST